MTERPSPGEQLAGIAGLALFLIMFLFAWYSWPSVGGASSPLNGLDAFDAYSDWLAIILILAAFCGMSLALFGAGSERSPVSLSVTATVLGGLSAILILIFIISTPSPPDFGAGAGLVEGDLGVEPGAWLGLIAAAVVAIGGYMTMQEEGVSFGGAADRLADRGPGPAQQPPPPQQQQPPPPPPPGGPPPPPPPPGGPPPGGPPPGA
jgi:hypothetical protein